MDRNIHCSPAKSYVKTYHLHLTSRIAPTQHYRLPNLKRGSVYVIFCNVHGAAPQMLTTATFYQRACMVSSVIYISSSNSPSQYARHRGTGICHKTTALSKVSAFGGRTAYRVSFEPFFPTRFFQVICFQ